MSEAFRITLKLSKLDEAGEEEMLNICIPPLISKVDAASELFKAMCGGIDAFAHAPASKWPPEFCDQRVSYGSKWRARCSDDRNRDFHDTPSPYRRCLKEHCPRRNEFAPAHRPALGPFRATYDKCIWTYKHKDLPGTEMRWAVYQPFVTIWIDGEQADTFYPMNKVRDKSDGEVYDIVKAKAYQLIAENKAQ